MLAALVFAMLLPHTSRSASDVVPAPLVTATPFEAVDVPRWEPFNPPATASAEQHLTAKTLQFGGAHVVGAAGAVSGGLVALLPGIAFFGLDSGNVGAAIVLCGAAGGYSLGAALAIYAAGREVTGVQGSVLMAALGTGAGIMLTGAAIATGALPEELAFAVAAVVPPLAGILVFELTKEGPSVRMPVPQGAIAILAGAGVIATGLASMRFAAIDGPAPRLLVPILQVRW